MIRTSAVPLTLIALTGAVAVTMIPSGPLPAETDTFDAWLRWWEAVGTISASLTIVRAFVLAGCAYVVMVAGLYSVGSFLRLRWLRRFALRIASPRLRRQLSVGIVAAAVVGSSAAGAQTAAPAEPIVLIDIGASADAAPGDDADVRGDTTGFTLTDLGPVAPRPIPPPPESHRAAGTAAGAHDPPPPATDGWLVEPGDHLWGIAVSVLERAGRPTDDATVAAYWARLISANASALRDDPDLIVPGQQLWLPPLDQG